MMVVWLVSDKAMRRIEAAFREIGLALEDGKFQRHELEGIIMFAEQLIGVTKRTLEKGPVNPSD